MPKRNIVVIGASAGGVEALSALLSKVEADLDAAILIVQHVPAMMTSAMPNILTRKGNLPARHATHGERIECGTVYIAPPDQHMLIEKGHITLQRGPKENNHRPAVDPLFRSAAYTYGARVIGVVLSGNLDDGTAGLYSIKSVGGLSIVQDPEEALYPGMPTSAIANVDIDYIAQLDEIATLINTITKEEAPIMDPNSGNSNGNNGDLRNDLFSLTDEARPVNEEELPGDPSFYTCPECHGTLWQVSEGDLLRFRCRVGHAYSAQTLSSSQGDALEAALYAAMRALEEARSLRTRMAQRARSRGLTQMAENFMAQSQEAEERANTIRAILIQTAPNPEHSLATIGESD